MSKKIIPDNWKELKEQKEKQLRDAALQNSGQPSDQKQTALPLSNNTAEKPVVQPQVKADVKPQPQNPVAKKEPVQQKPAEKQPEKKQELQLAVWQQYLSQGKGDFMNTAITTFTFDENHNENQKKEYLEKIFLQEIGFAEQMFKENTDLKDCDGDSIRNAIVNIVRLNVTLNPTFDLAYLVPRSRNGVKRCVVDLSFKALRKILLELGFVIDFRSFVIYNTDKFVNNIPLDGTVIYEPKSCATLDDHNKRKMVGVLSMAIMSNGNINYHYVDGWEVERIRKCSPSSQKENSAWVKWTDKMWQKTALRQHFPMLLRGDIHAFPQDVQVALQSVKDSDEWIEKQEKKKKKYEEAMDTNPVQDAEVISETKTKDQPVQEEKQIIKTK